MKRSCLPRLVRRAPRLGSRHSRSSSGVRRSRPRSAARAALAGADGDVDTIHDLLSRYEVYDAALTALYAHIRDTGRPGWRRVRRAARHVESGSGSAAAQRRVLAVIVGEAAAPAIAGHLVAIEQARDAVHAGARKMTLAIPLAIVGGLLGLVADPSRVAGRSMKRTM